MPPRLFCAGVQRTNWTPTEEEKWDLLRLANTKGKLMKALGEITRAPKMLEYLAAALAVDAHQLTANDAVKALVPAGFRAPRVDHVFKWIERLEKLETLLQAEESGRREQLIACAEDDVCWESETGLCLSAARTALRQEDRANARKKATLLRKMQPKEKNPDDLRGWRPSLLSIEEQDSDPLGLGGR